MWRIRRAFQILACTLLVGTSVLGASAPVGASNCAFVLGFRLFQGLTGDLVGRCTEDEHHNPANGDALQQTTTGLLVWRKADNWTAFTDGYRTWVNGPYGVQERLNGERFSWEAPRSASAISVQPSSSSGSWLDRLNFLRALGHLPAVSEDSSLDPAALAHARYIVKNDVVAHGEDPGNPWYSATGDQAARSSELIAFSWKTDDASTIDGLVEGPFHALGMLDPAMSRAGFGSYRDGGEALQTGADLYLGSGWGQYASASQLPVEWPANGATVPLYEALGGEHPDPMSACPGYGHTAGLPILFELGVGAPGTSIGGHSLLRDGAPVDHCVYDANSYTNPDGASQSSARQILGAYNAVVIVPRQPLNPGSTYTVSLQVNGQTYSWSFRAAPK